MENFKIKFTKKTELYLYNSRVGVPYRGYLIGELPSKFAYIFDEDNEKEGITQWFNLGGLTWLIDDKKKFKMVK